MKKLISILALSAAGAVLGACSQSEPAQETTITTEEITTTTQETATTTQETTQANGISDIGTTFEYIPMGSDDKWEITVTDVHYMDKIPAYNVGVEGNTSTQIEPTEDGKMFVVLDIKAKNTGTKAQTINNIPDINEQRKLIYDNQYEFTEDIITGDINEAGEINNIGLFIDGVTIDPLSEKNIKIAFQVPAEVAETQKPLNYKAVSFKDNKENFNVSLR